jgi:hypothetical protein
MKTRNQFTVTVATIAAASVWSLSALAQYPGPGPVPVFTDTLTNSTINQTSTPGGTPTDSSTSYDINSDKGTSGSPQPIAAIAPGDLTIGMGATSSAFTEAQAVFTSTPITLQNTGDYIDFILEFTDTGNLTTTVSQNALGIGLYNSGGVAPLTNNMNAGATLTGATGGTQGWSGYYSQIFGFGATGTTSSKIWNRSAQTVAEGDQTLLFETGSVTGGYGSPGGSQLINGSKASSVNLTNGDQYTEDFRITLTGTGQLSVTNTLYAGTGTGGSLLYTFGGISNNVPSTTFDSLAFGFSVKSSSFTTTQDVSLVEISTDVVPEPSTWMLLASGIAMMVGFVARPRRS